MPYKEKDSKLESGRRWYKNNTEKAKQKMRDRKWRIRQWYREYKEECSCQVCGEDHPACIVFHHRDPSTKKFEIANGAGDGKSIKTILKEIAKCDVLCQNCHAKIHWSRP